MSDDSLRLYGHVWTGDIRSTTGEVLMVEACWNDTCRTQEVPVAGLAPESSWDQYRPDDAPDGAPSQSPWAAPKAGECHTFYEWDDRIGISSCAATGGAHGSAVHLEVFLDLSVKRSELRKGDEASLHVTSAASDASLVDRTTTIDADAPYYVELDIEE
jgi:hypothetical protein